jgi:hypothetical protein
MPRSARYCTLVYLLAAALVLPARAGASASAQEPASEPSAKASPVDDRARLEAIYSAANSETQTGNFAAAADRYAEALALLPETHANHESRALALLDSVGARREAFTRTRDKLQLCRARDLLRGYLLTARTAYGTASSELDGPRQAARIHGEVEIQLAGIHAAAAGDDLAQKTCPGDQIETPPPPPAKPVAAPPPPPPRRDPRVVAGVTLLAVAGGSLGLMGLGLGLGAAAESRGADAHAAVPAPDIDALLADGFYQRGVAANRLAVVGAALAGAALVAGAALLVTARVRPRNGRLAVRGLGIGLRF